MYGISQFIVLGGHSVKVISISLIHQVDFIDDDTAMKLISLASHQKTVNKSGIEFWIPGSLYYPGPVDIRCQNLLTPPPECSLTGDVILTRQDLMDHTCSIIFHLKCDIIPHSQWIGDFLYIETESTRQPAVIDLLSRIYFIPLAC